MRAVLAAASTVVLCLSAVATARAGQPVASTDAPVPSGLVVVIDARALDDPSWRQALDDPSISGIALQIHWSDIEPTEGSPDWSKLDAVLSAAAGSKKWVQLLIFPGFFSPAWALEGAQTEQFPIQYGPGKGSVETLPMPWDTVYLSRWLAFIKRLSERYGKAPALRMIAAAGPTSVSGEFTLPNSPRDLKTWQDDSYTPSKYIGAWVAVFKAYAADFPDQYVSLSLGRGLSINDQGKIDAGEHSRTKQAIVDQAIGILGRRCALQYSNLDGTANPDVEGTGFLIGYNGRVVTGLQLRTSAANAGMGADGDPPLALRRSIDKGMQPNGAGQRANYLEIYEPDVLAPDMQPVLRYGAARFTP